MFASSSSAFASKPSAFGGFGNAATSSTPTASPFAGFGTQNNAQTQNQPQPSPFAQAGQQQQNTNPLFGGAQQQQQQQQQTNMFGQSAAAPANTFGQPAANNQNPLFGASKPATNTLFGVSQPQQQQNTNPLFGGSTQQIQQQGQSTLGAPFGGFGAASTATQQPLTTSTLGGQPATQQILFTRATKFNDMPDEVKAIFEKIEAHKQGRLNIANDLNNLKLSEQIETDRNQIRAAHKHFQDVHNTLQQDNHSAEHFKVKVQESVKDAIAATRIMDGFQNPRANTTHLKAYQGFPLQFYTKVTSEMKERLEWYKSAIDQIERKLSTAASRHQSTPQAITSTMQAQHGTFLALADRAAALHNELVLLKNTYRELWRAATGSRRDPFEAGLSSLDI